MKTAIVGSIILGGAVALVAMALARQSQLESVARGGGLGTGESPMPDSLTSMGGVREGAVAETIGGHPEDMNGSPPAIEPDADLPRREAR